MKVLFIHQEITPYLKETPMSLIGRYLPQGIQEKGKEIRIFMPRFGNINERKFTTAGVSASAGMGDAWAHPHDTNVVDRWGYYRGRDQWATIEATDTITIGDDALPIEMYDSLKTIASAPFVTAKIGGFWQKVVAAATFEADPRKTTFSATITLTIPSPTIQEF